MKYILLLLFLPALSIAQNCKSVKKQVDKFDGKITYGAVAMGPMLTMKEDAIPFVMLSKVVAKSDTVYVIQLSKSVAAVPGADNRKGVIFLFSDGSKLEKPDQEVTLSFLSGGTYLNADLLMDLEEFTTFRTKTLTDVRMIYSDGTIHPKLAKSLIESANCLVTTW